MSYQPPHMQPQNNPEHTRNMIVAVVLSLVIIVGYSFYDISTRDPVPEETAQATGETAGETAGVGPAPELGVEIPENLLPSTAPGDEDDRAGLLGAARVAIENDRVSGGLLLTGGRIDRMRLKGYRETLDEDSPSVQVLSPMGSPLPYYVEFGWRGADGLEVPGRETVWTADRDTLTPETPVTLAWTNAAGVTFELVYTIDENYMLGVTQRVVNGGDAPVTVFPVGLIQRAGTPEVSGFFILHEGLIGVLDESLIEIDYDDLAEDGAVEQQTTGGWLGITDKYWLTALIPDQDETVQTSFKHGRIGGVDRYQTDFIKDPRAVAPGETVETRARAFIGAKETLLLDRYRDEANVALFDRAVDFGWFYFLTKPIFYAIHWLGVWSGNFGVAILLLTLAIKLVFYPLADKSYRAMSKMKLLQPKMMELKERYGEDRQKMNMELMELYKKEKVNPLAGCWPILIQIPVFFALYKVLFVTIEMRHAPFFGWIQDLSAPDPLGILTLFGLIDWSVPGYLQIVNIGIWPIIMGTTMWLQMKLNPAPTDPIQAKVFGIMPFLFTFLLAAFPAGLVIYWAWNNLLSIAQQWTIMKRMGVAIGGGKAAQAPAAPSSRGTSSGSGGAGAAGDAGEKKAADAKTKSKPKGKAKGGSKGGE